MARPFVDVVPDGLGGLYVCWMENAEASTMFVNRLGSSGQIAVGWPAAGKALGPGSMSTGQPKAMADGSQGVYVAWIAGSSVVAQRLGPDGLGAGGWPNGSLTVTAATPASHFYFWPDLALGPDGGTFASWAAGGPDVVENGMYLRRLSGDGTNSTGWPTSGLRLAPFPQWVDLPAAPLLDISPDDRGGVFCVVGAPPTQARLRRMSADGTPAPGWPELGRMVPAGHHYYSYAWPDEGLCVYPDGQDGAVVESFYAPPHWWHTQYSRCSDAGLWSWLMYGNPTGHEVVTRGDGGAFVTTFKPSSPYSPGEEDAFLAVNQWYPPPGWTEWRETRLGTGGVGWFGDIALAPAGDGGVFFFWSQVRERFGLFARRFTNAGQVTAVEPEPGVDSPGLYGLRFVAGTGVVARVVLDLPGARLDLYDVDGRRLSSRTLDDLGSGATDVTLPATDALPSGLYFARLRWKGSVALGKVAIVR